MFFKHYSIIYRLSNLKYQSWYTSYTTNQYQRAEQQLKSYQKNNAARKDWGNQYLIKSKRLLTPWWVRLEKGEIYFPYREYRHVAKNNKGEKISLFSKHHELEDFFAEDAEYGYTLITLQHYLCLKVLETLTPNWYREKRRKEISDYYKHHVY